MVFSSGQVLTAAGLNGVTLNNIATYTPTIANGGSVTWTTRTGWYYKIGTSKIVFMCAYAVVNAAGSGSSTLTVTAPSNIDRTTRQTVGCDFEGGNFRVGFVDAFTGGSGAVFDRFRLVNSITAGVSNVVGSDLGSGVIITIQGFYREA
jgi:hypothetical protein